jgi:two-component system, OmpR family, sensor histidine kinase KdpD
MQMFKRRKLDIVSQYLLAVIFVLAVTVLLQLFKAYLSIQVIALLYLLPVVFSARLWGFGPSILAAVSAFFSLNYFFIPPYYTLMVHASQDILALIVFLANAIVVSQLLGRAQTSLEEATSREHEATQLYELSAAIAGQPDIRSIVELLAVKIHETFGAEIVGVLLSEKWGKLAYFVPSEPPVTQKPDFIFPLLTARGEVGNVYLWRQIPLSAIEQRFLRTITNQGALAIERAGLLQLETRAKVLEESDQLKSSLLNSVSHELRTPLATIKASISTLRSDSVELDTESRQELLLAIEEETDHLNQLVGNILDMSRIETGALHPLRKWNALSEIVNGVVKRMRQALQQHQVIIEVPDNLPLVPVDYIQMEQVFTNLLSNSSKYAPPNTQIKVLARVLPEGFILVKVSNQGPPVSEEHLGRIFEKFHRITASDKVTGTGLGLSICKGIIEAHGGRIWAENEPGRFVFYFTLPMNWKGNSPRLPEEI